MTGYPLVAVGEPTATAASGLGPHSARLDELQRKAAALREELKKVEAAIEAEQDLLRIVPDSSEAQEAAPPLIHHRPSWSLLGGTEEVSQAKVLRELTPKDHDFEAVFKDHPPLKVEPIGAFNHWDRRECAVANAGEWRARCEKYMREDLKGAAEIPKVIHQIWIGPKEPPCLWIDTFRVDFLAQHPEWRFQLWDDEEVSKLPQINERIYTEEKMWQCKADIVRLEMLWHHGGLYVDADMISVENKSLDPIIELGKETGFVIAYEPDTKDKPYSILGNSVIACTPHHPLILMLILYLRQTFYHKRNVIEVFAVTGPVMYTKCLVDSGMPISLAAQELLYPAFHFVPNPDSIDFSRFPKCLMFQFGYTCSGLEGYVKSKNRCKKARSCSFHSKKEWPLGSFRDLIPAEELEERLRTQQEANIPLTIHQLVPEGVDSLGDPIRWRRTWFDDFRKDHPNFQYRPWSMKDLRGRRWFCANLYVEPLDDLAAAALMLEVLFDEGGFYVPLSSTYSAGLGQDSFFTAPKKDFVEGAGGVVGAAKGSLTCYRRLIELYDKGQVVPSPSLEGPRITCMGYGDGAIARARFKAESRYLGAEQIAVFKCGLGDARLDSAAVGWAYECQVPCFAIKGAESMRKLVSDDRRSPATTVFIADYELFQMARLQLELPGILDRMGPNGWDVIVLGVEWNTGSAEVVAFNVPVGGRPQNCKVAGFVAKFPTPLSKQALRKAVLACATDEGFDPGHLFDAAGNLSLWFAAEKYSGSIEEARIHRCMPMVERVFQQIAGHSPPMHFDHQEMHGNLMKGFQHGRLRFEMILEPSGGVMYRCWNDDNSTNCEMKANASVVEWMKVYNNHQVAFEAQSRTIT